MENEDIEKEEVDALCRECGHGFKAYIDRMIPENKNTERKIASPSHVRFVGAVNAVSENENPLDNRPCR
jgi:hypothetical protein